MFKLHPSTFASCDIIFLSTGLVATQAISVVVVVIVVVEVAVIVELVRLLVAVMVIVGFPVVSVFVCVMEIVVTTVVVRKKVLVRGGHSAHATQVAQVHIRSHDSPSSAARLQSLRQVFEITGAAVVVIRTGKFAGFESSIARCSCAELALLKI